MKILHRFMLKQFIGPFVLMLFVVAFILLMQFLWKYVDELVGKGLSWGVIAEFLLYSGAQLMNLAFPLAVLMASIFTMSSLGENYELIALKSAGISLQRIVFPLVLATVVIAGCAFMFSNYVTPVANLKQKSLYDGIKNQRPEFMIREGIFSSLIDGYSIYIGHKNFKTNMLYDVRIYDHTEGIGNISAVLADSGRMEVTPGGQYLDVTLFHGHRYSDMVDKKNYKRDKKHPFSHQTFTKQISRMVMPDASFERSDEGRNKKGYQMMNLEQLTQITDSLAHLSDSASRLLQKKMQPLYGRELPKSIKIDTTKRALIPDNFMAAYSSRPKTQRLNDLTKAIADAKTQQAQLSSQSFETQARDKMRWRYDIEWYRKFTVAAACLVLFFIGAPLGALIRKGGIGTPIIVAVLIFVVYYVISMVGEKASRTGSMTPAMGMWLSTFVVSPFSIFLTYQATRDSVILSMDTYLRVWRNFTKLLVPRVKPRKAVHFQATADELQPEALIAMLHDLSINLQQFQQTFVDKPFGELNLETAAARAALEKIIGDYDRVRSLIGQTKIDIIAETAAEYPAVALRHYWMNDTWYELVMYLFVWLVPFVSIYFAFKMRIQRVLLRNEIDAILVANQNLTSELRSIL